MGFHRFINDASEIIHRVAKHLAPVHVDGVEIVDLDGKDMVDVIVEVDVTVLDGDGGMDVGVVTYQPHNVVKKCIQP